MPRDQRLAQREIDVVLASEVDGIEAAQRVGDPARADFQPDLAQHAPEGDDVPNDRASLHGLLRSVSDTERVQTRMVASHGVRHRFFQQSRALLR